MTTGYRQPRSETTRTNLMRAAEQLFADRGIENVTVRAIIEQAGQKNESALQYHFKNRPGLIEAIHQHRHTQVQEKRAELLAELLVRNPSPDLRELCRLMVEPAFLLARSDAGFRQWVKAFGQSLATLGLPAVKRRQALENQSTLKMMSLLRAVLSHLDDRVFEQRFDSAVRFVGLSMSQQAREKHAFRGSDSDVFFNMLIDAMTGLLAAEVSHQTRKTIAAANKTRSAVRIRETP